MFLHVEFYLFITLSVTLILLQGHSSFLGVYQLISVLKTLHSHRCIGIMKCIFFFELDFCRPCSIQIIVIFPCRGKKKKKKKSVVFFSDTTKARFATLYDYNLAFGLHCHLRFDDIAFVSVSQLCQK